MCEFSDGMTQVTVNVTRDLTCLNMPHGKIQVRADNRRHKLLTAIATDEHEIRSHAPQYFGKLQHKYGEGLDHSEMVVAIERVVYNRIDFVALFAYLLNRRTEAVEHMHVGNNNPVIEVGTFPNLVNDWAII